MSANRKRILIGFAAYVPLMLLAFAIYSVSDMSKPPVPKLFLFRNADKILHALAFFALGAFSALGTVFRYKRLTKMAFLEALLLAGLYGILDEWHQSWVPERTPSITDWLADLGGATLGISFYFLMYAAKKSSTPLPK